MLCKKNRYIQRQLFQQEIIFNSVLISQGIEGLETSTQDATSAPNVTESLVSIRTVQIAFICAYALNGSFNYI